MIVAANRGPIRQTESGWQPSVGGLATALLPVLEDRGGVWVCAKDEADAPERQPYPEESTRLVVRRIGLSEAEIEKYYLGMANSILWPLSHYMIHLLQFERSYMRVYRKVNRRFAAAVIEESTETDLIWIQDYHLMLAAEAVREQRPGARIGYFWHIPWPAMEVLRILPWARELVRGLLACNLIGFHVDEYVENFLESARVLLGARVTGNTVEYEGRRTKVEAHPIGIDVQQFQRLSEDAEAEAQVFRREAGTEKLIVGVDRLDYTKGIMERLLAFEQILQEKPEVRGYVSLFQVATPSRTEVESYRQLKREVDETVGRINGMYAHGNWVPVRYRYRTLPPEELAALYRAADVMLVTPLRDGMNLVAHEFVAAAKDGMLILSEMTGAAYLMPEAVLVNPYDRKALIAAVVEALEMDPAERARRMAALKTVVAGLDVHEWAGRFLDALETT